MLAEFVDGLVPSVCKRKTLNGYGARSRDGIAFMDLGVTTIRYRVAGHGPKTIVFVTDPPIVIEHYDYLVRLLENDYKIVIFEPPGFGFSIPSVRLDYRFDSVLRVMTEFLERLSLGPYIFVAPCVLGYSAIGLAGHRPDLISQLILPQVPSWEEMMKWKATRDPKGILSTPVIGQILLKGLKKKRTPDWFKLALGNKDLLEEFNRHAQTAYQHGATFNLASGFQRFLSGPSPLIKPVEQPTLFVWGAKDDSHCKTCKASSQLMLPGSERVTIDSAGHFPELETSDAFVGTIIPFVER